MPRVKRGTSSNKKRKRILKLTKGYRWSRKSKERAAKEALLHGLSRKLKGRKEKKRDYRRLWQVQLNAAVRPLGLNYNKFISALNKKNVKLDRKTLADLAQNEPEIFKKIVDFVK
jgi:large subunit ribosomal protein L20